MWIVSVGNVIVSDTNEQAAGDHLTHVEMYLQGLLANYLGNDRLLHLDHVEEYCTMRAMQAYLQASLSIVSMFLLSFRSLYLYLVVIVCLVINRIHVLHARAIPSGQSMFLRPRPFVAYIILPTHSRPFDPYQR
jgi:hypothetical protein